MTSTPPAADALPRHVAIIMDGNGRWARRRHMPRFAGHKAGVNGVTEAVRSCAECGIEALTLFAFSSENWSRPQEEVGLLMGLFVAALQHEVKDIHKNNVRLRVIGECGAFSEELQHHIRAAEALTGDNTGMELRIAANYGGRWDIVQAAARVAGEVQAGRLQAADIDEATFAQHLSLADLPEPDLFIRTGGDHRISNFLLWNLAYTEMYFTETLWPDFGREELLRALASYAGRQRRFGRTGDQVEQLTASGSATS